MALKLPLVIDYEDGTTHEVVADQRDMAAFEAAEGRAFGQAFRDMQFSTLRHVAFLAARRLDLLDGGEKRTDWELRAVEVRVERDTAGTTPDGPAGDAVVPGSPEASAGRASSSRSKAVRASGKSVSGGKTRTS